MKKHEPAMLPGSLAMPALPAAASHDNAPTFTTRREFIREVTVIAASLPWVAQSQVTAPAQPTAQVENQFLAMAFDTGTGRLRCWRKDGAPLLTGVSARATLKGRQRTTSEPTYQHTLDSVMVQDQLGVGQQLVIRSADREGQLDFLLRVTLYTERQAAFIEAECRNVSRQSFVLQSVEPVSASTQSGGALHWPGVTKVLTNGPMYYDPGKVADLPSGNPEAVRTWWNVGFFRGYDQEGLVCGFVDNQTALGQLAVNRGENAGTIGLVAEAVLAKAFELPPGGTVRSGRFMLGLAPDPYAALEAYAQTMGRALGARVGSVVNGWCNWFTSFEHINEEEILRNAEFAARALMPFGLEFIQVDEGFQRWHGDWDGNARFPHGMKWLADRIRALGLKPGIWIAPYVISEPTDLFQKHPEWLLRNLDGSLKRVGPWPSVDSDWARNENPKRYGLDITHPGAAAWLADLFDTVANRWGYDMVKIDFVDWSLLAADRYHDPAVSRAEAYRRGFEIMRRALGPDRHLQDCGPGPVTVGLLDSMRIELDQNYGFRKQAWKQYFLQSTSSAPAAAKRYYFHKRTWINDADHVCLNLLDLGQAQAAASLIALTGGNVISGDRLPDLDPSRLEILKKTLPSFGEAARPVDLFDTDRHCIFALKIRKPFGEWTVLGLFNASETEPLERRLPLSRLWLDPARTYLAYDFWNERLHGEVSGELQVRLNPASCVVVALHEKRNIPQVISTDRHILQGAIELENASWNPETRTIAGVSLGPISSAYNLTVYIPESQPWVQGGPFLFHDFPGGTAKMIDAHLLRLRIRFDHATRVIWEVNLGKLLAK
ncbi:MAG: glycoside hydrolase family 36 protein [Verrucomicrobiia bacterium]